jgi:PAS domain S-box-containing protein
MTDSNKSKEGLIEEVRALRERVSTMEADSCPDQSALKRSETRLREAQRVARIGSWERDLVTDTVTWSNQEYRLLGLEPGEIAPSYEAFLGFIHPDDREAAKRSAEQAIENGTPYDIEFRIIRRDGVERLLRSRAEVIYDAAGVPALMRGTGQDVTERRTAEAALKSSEEQYKTLVANIRGAVYRCMNDKDWSVIYMSDYIEELSGYPASDFLNKARSYASIIHLEDRDHVDAAVQTGIGKKEPYVIEYRIIHKNNTPRHVYEKGIGVFDSAGELLWLDGAIYDITEQKIAEEALADYREHLEELIETRTMALQLEIATRIEAEKSLTESKDLLDALSHAQAEFIAETDPVNIFNDLLDSLLSLTGSEYGFIARILHNADGEPYLKNFATTNIAWDSATEEFYEKHAKEGLEFTNMDTLFGAVVLTGEPVISNDPKNDERARGIPAGHPPLNAFLGLPFYSGEKLIGMVGLSNRKNGYDSAIVDFLKPFASTCANIIEGYNNSLKQAHAEVALKESEKRYRHLFENMNDAAFLAEVDSGTIIGTNRAAEALLGRKQAEIIGMHQSELHPEELFNQYRDIFNEHRAQETATAYECEVMRADGSIVLVDISASTFSIGGNKLVLGIFHDITVRKQMEQEIQKSQKLESLGLLAGGIAHDFNNLLTAIMGNVSFSLHFLKKEDKLYNRLIEAEKATMRARDLTKQLITFSKGGAPITETIEIGEMIEESASFALRGSNVKYALTIAPGTPAIAADPGQINQVLNNLIINADQSMPEGGTININAKSIDLGSDFAPLPGGRYVKISITDQGAGIPEKHLQKIFDPYFSTKQKGSGLGLASTYSIIEKHLGHIGVESEVGVGTTFTIYLPASGKKAAMTDDKETGCVKGTGKILVMDDEEIIQDLVREFLTSLGYTVESAYDGAETLELYSRAKEAGVPFDIVIMDLTIPGGMGGKETIKSLLEIAPYAKAIVSSGYSQDPIMAEFKTYGFSGVVAKPYRLDELASVVKSIITSSDD